MKNFDESSSRTPLQPLAGPQPLAGMVIPVIESPAASPTLLLLIPCLIAGIWLLASS